MKISEKKAIEIENFFNENVEYVHYKSATKILEILGIHFETSWTYKTYNLTIDNKNTFDEEKVFRFLNKAIYVCKDASNGYQVDSGDALNSVLVLQDIVEILGE